MPRGVYERTEYHRKVMSDCHKGIIPKNLEQLREINKGHKYNVGKKRTQEFKDNLSRLRKGKVPNNYKGGVINDSRGYIIVNQGGKSYRPQHRLVVEQHIGRGLDSSEIVHHIDFDRKNNDISNLQITTRAEHRKLHTKHKEVCS